MDTTRIDKWLWAARFFKTRSLATDAVERGKVKLRGERTKPSHGVKAGDMLQIDNGATEWEVQVCAISDKRGSAAVAQGLYGETAASVEKRRLLAEQNHFFKEPTAALKGRPTKRDRRLLDQSSS
ncbi:RNA-binding S4 domain-containing protein [Herbaspirillum lusitanum]|uniref:RNA-binding S4 domain-containing protein n=1 Tax=Herbaspirillum lusitanum TaxID=213312 RepID=UPI002238E4C7|nr:RNA-binding S4 domain-containing protein [Herbaspirillum lusitanum]MCW5300663.1 RNA-binding S4 domain-containing protein [Herbaspirillum lusitanum]